MSGAIVELVEAAGEEGALIGEAGELADETKLLDDVGDASVSEAPDSIAADADASAALAEGSDMVMVEAKAGGTFASLNKKLSDAVKFMWDNKAAFAKMMGTELAKGAFFTVGMIAVEKIFAKKQDTQPTSDNQKRLDIVKAINKERAIISPVMKEWRTWLADHFDSRENYGVVTAEDTSIQRFQILQNKISDAQHFADDTVAKATATLKEVNDTESAKDLLKQEIEWVGKIKTIGESIKSKESLMVAAGLKDNTDKIDQGKKLLDDANK